VRLPVEILGDTEIFFAERVSLCATAVHLSQSHEPWRAGRALAKGAESVDIAS